MEIQNEIKTQLIKICEEAIEKRIKSIQEVLNSIQESKNNETKSSVGDKYETGRSMMQLEEEKNKRQLFEAYQVQQELSKIKLKGTSHKVERGSLVETNKGAYFLSIGLGKIQLEGRFFYCISIKAPIGIKLMNKVLGDEIEFNGNNIKIERIS